MGKKRKKGSAGKIFFAYQSKEKSGDSINIDAIKAFAQNRIDVKTWESMKSSGKLLNRDILDAISSAEIFACDLTYINFNVYFELGFAIGKRKFILPLINNTIKNALNNFNSFAALRGIGYKTFKNAEDIRDALKSIDRDTVLMEQFEQLDVAGKNTHDIFYIQSSSNSQAELNILEYIKNEFSSPIIDERYESAYETLGWYLSSINKCKAMVVHLSSNKQVDSDYSNAINSFYAGIGHALGKKVLFLSPTQIIPVDYDDICIQYDDSKDCIDKFIQWVRKNRRKITQHTSKKKIANQEFNLLLLGIGYSVAEREKDDLVHYFVPTYVFYEAQKRNDMIIYGRKGAGKTAVYYKLIDDYSHDETAITLHLKPESSELIDYIRVSMLFDDSIRRSTLFSIIWRFQLGSQLLIELFDMIIHKKKDTQSSTEEKLCNHYRDNEILFNQSFFKTASMFHDFVVKENITADKAVEKFVKEYLTPLFEILKENLKTSKYTKVIVLADNLDKAWSADSDLHIQSDMILSLLQVSGSFQNMLTEKKSKRADVSCIIFLRDDIYKYIITRAREPDRLETMSYRIEWESCRPLLKVIVEERMRYVLDYGHDENVDSLWNDFFEANDKIFALVEGVCLPRPRDIISVFGKMFENACNNNRLKVNHDDYVYAVDFYMSYLRNNVIAECNAEYPYIREIITEIDSNQSSNMKYNDIVDMLNKHTGDESTSHKILSTLFMNKIVYGASADKTRIFDTYDDFINVISKKNKYKLISKILKRKFIIIKRDLITIDVCIRK